MKSKTQKRQFENIYDILKGHAIKGEPKNEWEILSKEHAQVATAEFKKFIQNKEITWDGDNDIITIGKTFKIKLL